MKTKYIIYYFDTGKQKPDKTYLEGWVMAKSILDALKIWHINLRGAFFQNSTYHVEKAVLS